MQVHIIDEKLLEFDTKVSQVYVVNEENIKTMIDDHESLHVKVRDLEDKTRRNYLRFDQLSQAQGEDWHENEAKIKQVIKEKLVIENDEIECAHRIGKDERDDSSQIRTIQLSF